jgi:hypothetical protein
MIFFVKKDNVNIFVICLFIFFYTELAAQSVLDKYANFTAERQIVLEKMGDFFEKTIRENFPTKTDTSSYRAFFKCIVHNGGVTDIPYVMQVDRKRLAEINNDLFNDEIYYFFYARYLRIQMKNRNDSAMYQHYNDTIPTERFYTTDIRREIKTWYPLLHNRDGYLQRIVEQNIENPLIRDMNEVMEFTHNYDIVQFMGNVLNKNLREMSNPVVKQLAAMLFWRYFCFCGGIDLESREGFCNECVESNR